MRKPHLILTTLSLCAASASFIVPALAQDTTNTQNTSERPIVYPSASIANFQPLPLNEVLLSVDVVTSEEIERSTASSVSEVIAQKTGIEFSRTGGPGAVTSHFLRGQKSANYVLLVDGIRVHGDTYGNVITPELAIAQIEKIESLKGNASALYGEAAVGGVINIITKSGSLRDSGFISTKYGSYDTAEVSAGISKYVNGFNLSFAGTKFETEGFDVRSDSTTNPDKDGYSQDSYNFTLSRRLSSASNITIGLRNRESDGDYDDTVPSGTSTTSTHVHNTENQESFITYELEKGAAIDLRLDYNQAKRTRKDFIDGAPAKTAVSWKNNVIKGNSKTLKLVNISRLRGDSVQHSLTQGIELIDAYYDSDGSRSERDTEAAFLGYGAKFGAHDVQTNLRHDKVSLKTTSDIKADMKETSYLAGYGYRFAEHYKIALSHATGFRAPSAGEYGSNQDLKPETYTSNEVSLQRDKNGRLLRLTAFSTETDNEIKWLSVSPWTPENIQKNENIGLEVSYSGTADKFDFDLDITFQDPKETDTTTSSGGQSLKRAKAYGKLNLSRQIGNYQIGGTLTHSGRKLDSGSKTIASFTRLDGYISRQLGDNLSVNLKAENITNSEYETTAGYRTPERSLFLTLKYDFVSAL